METFVADSLADQLKNVLGMDDVDEKSLDAAMEKWKTDREARWATGQVKRQKLSLLPKPDDWDSDAEGAHWADQDGVWQPASEPTEQSSALNGASRGRQVVNQAADDSDAFMDDDFEDVSAPAAPAKRTTAAKSAKPAAPAKKAATTRKAPARGRGKKSALLEDSDDDMFLDDDDEDSVVVPPPKKQPARATASRSTASAASKRQTTLNFSQSQQATQRGKQQAAVEISDDEISEDDAFESMPVTRSTRRR